MSEEVRTNKRRRSESEEPEDETGDGAGADVVGAGGPGPEVLDGTRGADNVAGDDADDGADQAAADAAAAAAEQPKMPAMQAMALPIQMTHHQPRMEEKQPVDNYYKTDQQPLDAGDYKVGGANAMSGMSGMSGMAGMASMASMAGMAGMAGMGMSAAGMGGGLGGLAGMGGLATLGVPGMGLGVGGVDLNQQILAAQQRQYEMNAAIVKAQMNNNAVAAARAAPKPPVPTGRKSAPSSYEPPVQLTASGRPARSRRVNYAELAGAMDDEEEDDQANLVPNWARRRRKNNDQDRDYGVGVGGGARGGGVQMGGPGGNPAMYGMAALAALTLPPRAAPPTAGVNLYGLAGQGATGLRNAVGAGGGGLQAANLAGIANNAALAGQAGWQGKWCGARTLVWANPYGALQSLAAAQARPQVAAAQQFLLQPGAGRGVAPNIMQDMLMLSRGADGQGGMPGAGQQR